MQAEKRASAPHVDCRRDRVACRQSTAAHRIWSSRMVSVEMYSTAICPYCMAAKNLLKQKGMDYTEIRVDTDRQRYEEMLARTGGRRSVPQIFVNGVFVGGFDDLVAADRSGKLAEIVATPAA